MKPTFDPRDRDKLNIRLPGDHGPNPYDSKTPPQFPEWLTSIGWWAGIMGAGCAFVITRYISNGGHL